MGDMMAYLISTLVVLIALIIGLQTFPANAQGHLSHGQTAVDQDPAAFRIALFQ
ncbi:MAG: hypothetical protein AAGC83_08845 [Pseudomonadota bacterium]